MKFLSLFVYKYILWFCVGCCSLCIIIKLSYHKWNLHNNHLFIQPVCWYEMERLFFFYFFHILRTSIGFDSACNSMTLCFSFSHGSITYVYHVIPTLLPTSALFNKMVHTFVLLINCYSIVQQQNEFIFIFSSYIRDLPKEGPANKIRILIFTKINFWRPLKKNF